MGINLLAFYLIFTGLIDIIKDVEIPLIIPGILALISGFSILSEMFSGKKE